MEKFRKQLIKVFIKKQYPHIDITLKGKSVKLAGKVDTWNEYVTLGYLAAKLPFKGVVNDIEVTEITPDTLTVPKVHDMQVANKSFDVTIIGGGITGAAIARTLARWNLKIAVLEKEEDAAMHASGRNDGIIHAGIAPRPNTLKSKMNVRGNYLYPKWAEELGFTLSKPGTLIILTKPWYKPIFKIVFTSRIKKTGIPGATLMNGKKLHTLLPALQAKGYGAYLFPSTGCISPYRATIAMLENAVQNGVKFITNCAVTDMNKEGTQITTIRTNRGTLRTKLVINAAGMWADTIAGLADDRFFSLHPRKGNIIVLNKKKTDHIPYVVSIPRPFTRGSKTSKGGAILPTVDNNLLIGPDAFEQPYREDYSIDDKKVDHLFKKYRQTYPIIKKSDVLKVFSGIRAATWKEDFIIEKSEKVDNLIHAAGIQSPGVASAPAIAERVEKLVLDHFKDVKPNTIYNPKRDTVINKARISIEKKSPDNGKNPVNDTIICRCEQVSREEIQQVLGYHIKPENYSMIKRRTRCGHGVCGGKHCRPEIEKLINEKSNQ